MKRIVKIFTLLIMTGLFTNAKADGIVPAAGFLLSAVTSSKVKVVQEAKFTAVARICRIMGWTPNGEMIESAPLKFETVGGYSPIPGNPNVTQKDFEDPQHTTFINGDIVMDLMIAINCPAPECKDPSKLKVEYERGNEWVLAPYDYDDHRWKISFLCCQQLPRDLNFKIRLSIPNVHNRTTLTILGFWDLSVARNSNTFVATDTVFCFVETRTRKVDTPEDFSEWTYNCKDVMTKLGFYTCWDIDEIKERMKAKKRADGNFPPFFDPHVTPEPAMPQTNLPLLPAPVVPLTPKVQPEKDKPEPGDVDVDAEMEKVRNARSNGVAHQEPQRKASPPARTENPPPPPAPFRVMRPAPISGYKGTYVHLKAADFPEGFLRVFPVSSKGNYATNQGTVRQSFDILPGKQRYFEFSPDLKLEIQWERSNGDTLVWVYNNQQSVVTITLYRSDNTKETWDFVNGFVTKYDKKGVK
jgi:hypothetical protein